jgi:hypothetical protein
MKCSHGRESDNCLLCSHTETRNLVAKHAQIAERAAAEQSAFNNEQRARENLRETAESVKASMRHDFLLLVREGKNKTVDLGNGEVKLDAADIELYWAEYREAQFSRIEQDRSNLNNQLSQDFQELYDAIRVADKTMLAPNIGIAAVAGIVGLSSIATSAPGGSISLAIIGAILTFAGVLGFIIFKTGMPQSQDEWIPPALRAVPAAAVAFSFGQISLLGLALGVGIIYLGRTIRAKALQKNPTVVASKYRVAVTQEELEALPSQELLVAIRRLN